MKFASVNVDKAVAFFSEHMHHPLQLKRAVYQARNVRLGSVVTPSDWEVFASLLTNRLGNGGVTGIDLGEIEVKSAMNEGSYEYQYHKETGKMKLKADSKAGHLFINHSDFLNLVEVRYLRGEHAKEFFASWLKNYPNPYPQRYRNSLPFRWVKSNAKLVLVIKNGKVQLSS